MQPPFFGTKILDALSLDDIEPLIDRDALFASRWQFRRGTNLAEWESIKLKNAIPTFERILAYCRANQTIEPKISYGYFRCKRQGNKLIVEGDTRSFGFDFPREQKLPHRCIADFFPDGFVTIQLATVGAKAAAAGAAFFAKQEYSEAFFLKGLAAEAAEATAVFGHRLICGELGVKEGCGTRFSPGYPAFPDIFAQRKITALIAAKQIGVSLTETCQLIPEYSTTSFISVDPNAVHFRP